MDASYGSAVAFASAAQPREVMPQSPQTTPASTIASALVKSVSSVPTERSSGSRPLPEALQIAREQGLDLVEVAARG